MDSCTQRGRGLSLQDHQFRTFNFFEICPVFSLSPNCMSAPRIPIIFEAPFLALYIRSAHPYSPATNLSALACSCSAQTRAKRLILALRPGKLSSSPPSLLCHYPFRLTPSQAVCMDTRDQAGTFDLFV